ncbi:MAG: hypothetical protein ACFFCO_13030 [Promethearchaeota archaeon]
MNLSWERIGALCGILGPTLFTLFLALAVLVYPGDYNFITNHISDLGLTVTHGVPSPLNYLLIICSYTSAAICLVPFWLSLRTVFFEPRRMYHTSLLGSIAGLIATVFLSASALIPGDLLFQQHRWAAIFFFFFHSSAILVYAYAILATKEYGNLYALIGIVFVAILYVHATIPGFDSPLVQKVIMFGFIFWSAFQSYKLLKTLA